MTSEKKILIKEVNSKLEVAEKHGGKNMQNRNIPQSEMQKVAKLIARG